MQKTRSLKQRGFTLIELLVVIAIIGVLAAVVLIAVNPIEQINRANDSGVKDAVSTVANAAQALATSTSAGSAGGTFAYVQASGATGQDPMVTSQDLKQPNSAVMYYTFSCTGTSCTQMNVTGALKSQQSVTAALAAGASGCTSSNTYEVFAADAGSSAAGKSVGYFCGTVGASFVPSSSLH